MDLKGEPPSVCVLRFALVSHHTSFEHKVTRSRISVGGQTQEARELIGREIPIKNDSGGDAATGQPRDSFPDHAGWSTLHQHD